MQKVVTQDEFGGPDVLHIANGPVPEPLPTEIRVRVRAAGINPVDVKTRTGAGVAAILGAPPFVLGWDVAGVVDALGPGVTRFSVGERVLGMPWFPREAGCYGEYVAAPSRHFVRSPDGVDDSHAAALPLAGLTAWQALVDTAGVRSGQRVVVVAAGGGVGHLAVQIASSLGAHVTAVASAPKHDLLAALGADQMIDYRSADVESEVRDVDVAVELVGGEATMGTLRTVRPGGTLVVVAGPVAPDVAAAAEATDVRLAKVLVEPDHLGLARLTELMNSEELRVIVSNVFPMADAASAHRAIERGHTVGKIVLTM